MKKNMSKRIIGIALCVAMMVALGSVAVASGGYTALMAEDDVVIFALPEDALAVLKQGETVEVMDGDTAINIAIDNKIVASDCLEERMITHWPVSLTVSMTAYGGTSAALLRPQGRVSVSLVGAIDQIGWVTVPQNPPLSSVTVISGSIVPERILVYGGFNPRVFVWGDSDRPNWVADGFFNVTALGF